MDEQGKVGVACAVIPRVQPTCPTGDTLLAVRCETSIASQSLLGTPAIASMSLDPSSPCPLSAAPQLLSYSARAVKRVPTNDRP
jgi:hypothetical protein